MSRDIEGKRISELDDYAGGLDGFIAVDSVSKRTGKLALSELQTMIGGGGGDSGIFIGTVESTWEFTTEVSAYDAEASERFSIVMDVETSILHPKYLYALMFPELVMDYSDEDGLSSEFLIPLHYNENTDEVEEYPEGLRACMIILHQRGIPIMLAMHAGEVEDFTYVLSLEYLGESLYGRWGFRLREVISLGSHLPFVGEYCLGVSWDAGAGKNILTPSTNTPLLSPRYMPITMGTPWSTLSENFGFSASLAGTTYEGVFLHISAQIGRAHV